MQDILKGTEESTNHYALPSEQQIKINDKEIIT
jgi:hypothetical protein